MEMVNSEVRVITGRVLHVTPDDLRSLANQMELASKTAGNRGKVLVELVEGFVLTYDPLLKVTKVKPENPVKRAAEAFRAVGVDIFPKDEALETH